MKENWLLIKESRVRRPLRAKEAGVVGLIRLIDHQASKRWRRGLPLMDSRENPYAALPNANRILFKGLAGASEAEPQLWLFSGDPIGMERPSSLYRKSFGPMDPRRSMAIACFQTTLLASDLGLF